MSRVIREAFGRFATGCTVVTTRDAEQDIGLTCSSFNTVSLEPPMVLWSLRKEAQCAHSFLASERFAVTVLGLTQADIAWAFATGEQAERFAQARIERLPSGLAAIEGGIAVFDCRVDQCVDAGDHWVFIGLVDHLEARQGQSLVFAQSQFCRLEPMS